MFSLIAKDFAVQKRSFPVYVVLGFMFFFFFYSMGDASLPIVMFPVFIIGYGFMNRSLMEDERNHTLRLLASLPIGRREIVTAKYASIILVIGPVFAVFWLVGIATGLTNKAADEWPANLLLISLFFLAFMLLISFYLPLVYRVGFVRAQAINRFLYLGLIAFGISASAVVGKLAERSGYDGKPPEWVDKAAGWVSGISVYAGVLLILSAAFLLYVCSMMMSVKIFEKRELF